MTKVCCPTKTSYYNIYAQKNRAVSNFKPEFLRTANGCFRKLLLIAQQLNLVKFFIDILTFSLIFISLDKENEQENGRNQNKKDRSYESQIINFHATVAPE